MMSTKAGVAPVCRVALVHTMDPRGTRVGGIETFTRDYIALHPETIELLMIGVDGFGDLELGKVHDFVVFGRSIKFVPLIRVLDNQANVPATGLLRSVVARFLSAFGRHYLPLRKLLREGGYSMDLRRIEFSPIPVSLGLPFVQMLHDGMSKGKQMSSLIRKVWWIKTAAEGFALKHAYRFYCVNSDLTDRLKAQYPKLAGKLGTLPTWANPLIYSPTPFQFAGDAINIFYAGRLDLFKRPDLMFRTVAACHALSDTVRFHYVGDGDPETFTEFAAIRDITIRHGVKTSPEIAALLAGMHVGILTSDFEGMPRVVMEQLTAGRPVVALHLPQLEAVIVDGASGFLIPRGDEETQVRQQAAKMLETYQLMVAGTITPADVAAHVAAFTPQALLGKLWTAHLELAGVPA